MDSETFKRYFGRYPRDNSSTDFPPPKPKKSTPTFNAGDRVIVTTNCEDIGLHELTGRVRRISPRTGSVLVRLDVDGSLLPFLPHELGHHF